MYSAFKQYLLTLKLSQISRKLYLADVRRFLIWLHQGESDLFDVLPDLDEVVSDQTYTRYLESLKAQQVAPAILKRTVASLRQFGGFISRAYAVPNPMSNFSLVFKPSPNSSNFAFQNYIKHFTNYLNSEHLSPLTIKSYKSDITRYLDYSATHYPSTRITELLSTKNIKKYLNHLTNSDSALSSTIERKSKSISRFTAWLGQSYPKLAISDNNESASKALENTRMQDKSNFIPAPSSSLSAPSPASSEVEDNLPKISSSRVKNNNYRKMLNTIWTPSIRSFVSLAILLIFASALSIFAYRQFSSNVSLTAAYPSTPVTPNRQLSFQGRLENAAGTPITSATNLTFKLWNQLSGGTEGSCTGGGDNCLYSTGTCSITPDADGVFSTQIGSSCGSGIPSSVFTENSNIWLEVVVAAETLTPRQPIASVAYALNSETIQGFPISSTVSAIRNTVVPMNQWGEILVGEQSPRLTGVSGTFQISAPSLSLVTATGTNGNITLAPDGTGQVNINGNTTTTNFFNVSNAQLTTGSLITGTAGNDNTGFNLINLLSGSSPTSKFSVTDAGLTTVGADLYVSSGVSLFNNAVTDDTVEAGKFCTGDGETNCVTDFSAISGGASIWTDGGTYAYLTNGEVIGNSASAGINKVAGLYVADSAPVVFGTDNDITLTFAGTELGVSQGNNDVNFDSNTLFVDGSTNRVGIGTATPDYALDIEQLQFWSTDDGLARATENIYTTISTTNINQSGYLIGARNVQYAFPDSGVTYSQTMNGYNEFGIAGGTGGTVTNAAGVNAAAVSVASGGTITNAAGFRSLTPWTNSGVGSITNSIGFQSQNMGGAGITNAYGIYLDSQSGASTSNYAIYTNAGINRFGDDVYLASGLSTFGTAVTDGTVEATKFCTGDGETNCVSDFAPLVSGSSIWTDGGTYVYPTNGEVIGNSASAGSNKLAGLYVADSAPVVFGTDNDITLTFAGTELGVAQGNNDINFDSNTLFIDGSANRVGIGTAAPNTQLEISNTGGTANFRLTGSGANVVHQIADEYDINYTRTTGSATIDFRALSADTTSTGDYRFGLSSGSTGSNRIFLYQPNSATIQTKLATSGESSYINSQGGNLGIGTTGPDAKLDSLSTTTEQLRLTYTDGTVYSGFTLDSSGNLTINNTGTKTTISDDLEIVGDDLIMATNTSGFILVADGTNFNPVAVSGDITLDSAGAAAIGSDKITEAMLKSVNAPTDELCLSYESTVGDFEWQTCGSGGGGSNWRYNLGAISPINDTVDLLVGSNATASAKFAVLNVNSGTPTASVSAGTTGATFLTADGYLSTTARQSLTLGNSATYDTTGNILLHPNATGRVGIGTSAPDAQLEINHATGNNLRLTYNDVNGAATAYTDFTLASDGDLTIDSAGGAITIGAGDDLNLTAATDLIFGGTTSLGETTAAGDSGAFLVGSFDEFDNSNSLNVQAVLNDLDAALSTALLGSSLWTDGGTYIYPTGSETLGNDVSGGANKIAGLYLADSAPFVFGTDNDFTFSFNNAASTLGSTLTAGTRLGINTTSALATVDIRSSLGTIPVASISGNTSMAALIVDQSGSGDIFTASSSGETRFVVKSNGNVGIGASDPTSKLQIAGTTSTISNSSGDLTIDSFSGNLVLGTDDDLIPTLGAGDANIGAVGTPWDNIYATVLHQNGNLVCDDSGANCPVVGASWWDQASGTVQPYNKTVDLLLGGTATDSAKIALININSGTPTASVSAGTAGSTYLTATGIIATTAKQTLSLGDATTTGNIILQGGNVGIGVAAPVEKLEVNGNVVSQRFIDSANSAYYLDAAATGTSLSIEGNVVSNGAFSITSSATNGNITIDAGTGTVLIGAAGAGKLDAGTIDPPYTINGEKFATYMAGMTGVKEETTGTVKAVEYVAGSGYRATLDFANSLTGSDLWLFSKTSNLRDNLDKLVVLLSTSSNTKTWYELDPQSGKLYLYATSPTNISYRLTAPRFDADSWLNSRDSQSVGFVINDEQSWSVSDTIASAIEAGKSQFETFFGNVETNLISPLATDSAITIKAPVIITPPEDAAGPALYVDGEIESSSISARLATLENIQADTITAKNIIADTIEANHIIGLDARIASLSAGISESDLTSITDRIKSRLAALTGNSVTAEDIPVTEAATSSAVLIPEVNQDSLSTDIASVSATIANLDADFVTINNYLAVIGHATITSLSVTDQLNVGSIQSTDTTTLALQPLGGTINLASGTLIVDSLGEVAVNGNLTVSGKVLASAVETDYIAIGTPKDASSSALGQLLAIYNESGEAVATIDASGSANLASVTTKLITIAAGHDATPSGLLTATAQSNSTAGESILISPNTELTIESPYITANSLVYLTPTTNTDNKVLFVKAKTEESFTVGIDAPAGSDISFNWWIIQLDKSNDN